MSDKALQRPQIQDDNGQTYAPAHEVSALLPRLGTQWCDWNTTGVMENLDSAAADALTGALGELADQIDVQRIGHRTHLTEGPQ